MAEHARTLPGLNWDSLDEPNGSAGAERLGSLLGYEMAEEHFNGNETGAIERFAEAMQLAQDVARADPQLSGYEDQTLEYFALRSFENIAVDLRVGGMTGVRRDEVTKLIAELDDEKAERAIGRRDLMALRAGVMEFELAKARRAPLLGPMFNLEAARRLALCDVAVSAADARDWPAALRRTDEMARMDQSNQPPGSWMAGPSGFGDLPICEFADLNERHAAAACLAVRVYWLDHKKWPAGLADLVPRYLPSVPMDMITGGNQAMGYIIDHGLRPLGVDRPLLYFDTDKPKFAHQPPGFIFVDTPTMVVYGDTVEWRDLSLRHRGRPN